MLLLSFHGVHAVYIRLIQQGMRWPGLATYGSGQPLAFVLKQPRVMTLCVLRGVRLPQECLGKGAWANDFLRIRIAAHGPPGTQLCAACSMQPLTSVRACLGACTLHSASPWGPCVAAATPACVEAGLACALACVRVCAPVDERACVRVCANALPPATPWS